MKAIVRKSPSFKGGKYNTLLKTIGVAVETARQNASRAVNSELVKANWEIGRHIIEYEQSGHERAEYGSELLAKLSRDLKRRYGAGFGRRNVLDMRRFYLAYPIWQTVSAKLSWSHFILLLGISREDKRLFYQKKSIDENWSVRELERQIDAALFERLRLSKKKKSLVRPNRKLTVKTPDEIIKDPYVLDFLRIPQSTRVTEKELERKIIDNIQMFLLELGKGFAFIGRQYKMSFARKHFYVDLVFYHYILKCFVLVDLKTRAVNHNDIGQMNLYLNYFKAEESTPGDTEPIGIILSADKDDVLVEYATGGISNKIFVSKYRLYLPDKKQLTSRVRALISKL